MQEIDSKLAHRLLYPTPEEFALDMKALKELLKAQEVLERRNGRSVEQTINEDGYIWSPLDGKRYTSVLAWKEHVKRHGVIEAGNEIKPHIII